MTGEGPSALLLYHSAVSHGRVGKVAMFHAGSSHCGRPDKRRESGGHRERERGIETGREGIRSGNYLERQIIRIHVPCEPLCIGCPGPFCNRSPQDPNSLEFLVYSFLIGVFCYAVQSLIIRFLIAAGNLGLLFIYFIYLF